MARPPRTPDQRADDEARHRGRVLGGLATCIAEKGYAATTMADVAAAAGVSKATLYGRFRDKHEAFLALYSQATDHVLAHTRQAAGEDDGDAPWQERLLRVTERYLEAMARGEGLTRCLLVEVQAVSPEALALRREVLDRYVAHLREFVATVAADEPGVAVPPDHVLLGVAGGMNEHMLAALEAAGPAGLPSVARACTDLLIVAVAGPHALPAAGHPALPTDRTAP